MITFVVVIASAGAQPTPPADGPLTLGYELKFLDTTVHPLAVCNDGTPAAFYLHRGDPTQWVIHQQGGWWCWDDYSCQVRWEHFLNHTTEKRTLMSTAELSNLTQLHDTFNGEKNTGIMAHNASVSPVGGASKVFVVYCSSDSHAGNRTTPSRLAPTGLWHFRGKEIVRAVLAELAEHEQLGAAEQVVLTGGSAGGMATLNNADWVGGLLRGLAPAARLVSMPDSGYFLDVMPGAMCEFPDRYECKCAQPPALGEMTGTHGWLGAGTTLAQQAQNMLGYTGGLPDESCVRAAGGRWGAWRCYLGQYAAPHLQTPTLLLQSQIDEWQVVSPHPSPHHAVRAAPSPALPPAMRNQPQQQQTASRRPRPRLARAPDAPTGLLEWLLRLQDRPDGVRLRRVVPYGEPTHASAGGGGRRVHVRRGDVGGGGGRDGRGAAVECNGSANGSEGGDEGAGGDAVGLRAQLLPPRPLIRREVLAGQGGRVERGDAARRALARLGGGCTGGCVDGGGERRASACAEPRERRLCRAALLARDRRLRRVRACGTTEEGAARRSAGVRRAER